MSALAVYESLPEGVRPEIERRALARVGAAHWSDAPADASDALTLADALGDDDHPALREELRTWWLERATTDEILARIDAADDPRVRELAIVLCAESCAHLTDDPRVAECRRVRLAWVRGEATDEQRDAACAVAWDAASDAAGAAASDTAGAAASDTAWDAAGAAEWAVAGDAAGAAAWAAAGAAEWDIARDAAVAALATPLRTLYPDPCAIEAGVALANWDVAVAEAHRAFRPIGGTS